MSAISASDFAIGATSSFVASLAVLVLTHLDDIRFILSSPTRYRYLSGAWYQHHLTCDSRHSPPVFWTIHTERLEVTHFGRIRGKSVGKYGLGLEYKVKGAIRQHVMRLRYVNQSAHETPVTITYPRLLSSEVIAGIWIGHDYDERPAAAPIVLARRELSALELTAIVRVERLLTLTGRNKDHPVVDPAPSADRSPAPHSTDEANGRSADPSHWDPIEEIVHRPRQQQAS